MSNFLKYSALDDNDQPVILIVQEIEPKTAEHILLIKKHYNKLYHKANLNINDFFIGKIIRNINYDELNDKYNTTETSECYYVFYRPAFDTLKQLEPEPQKAEVEQIVEVIQEIEQPKQPKNKVSKLLQKNSTIFSTLQKIVEEGTQNVEIRNKDPKSLDVTIYIINKLWFSVYELVYLEPYTNGNGELTDSDDFSEPEMYSDLQNVLFTDRLNLENGAFEDRLELAIIGFLFSWQNYNHHDIFSVQSRLTMLLEDEKTQKLLIKFAKKKKNHPSNFVEYSPALYVYYKLGYIKMSNVARMD